jgi:magnesium transporter
MIVDRAIYRDGRRTAEPSEPAHMDDAGQAGDALAWVELCRPTEQEFAAVAHEFGLHMLASGHAVHPHQRPRLERYGDTLFCVLRTARYVDESETVEFGEVHLYAGPHFVVTVRHGDAPDVAAVRHALESRPDLLRRGPVAILHAIMDRVVDDYAPVVAGVENDIDEIEDQVFDGDPAVSRRIYELSREVIEFQRATQPLAGMLRALAAGFAKYGTDEELQRLLRDVEDHTTRIVEHVDRFRLLLQNILSVNATLVAQRQNEEAARLTAASLEQNEEVKRISSWAAILFAPTLVGTVYGMNFDHIPELHWTLGYPYALSLMLLTSVTLYLLFKRRGWL